MQDDGSALTRIWRSIFRGPLLPRTDRERKWVVFNTLVLHLRPVRVPAKTIRYTHTFGLGGSSMVLILLLMATGILMMFVYEPSPASAYDSITTMQQEVLFGQLVRAVHHWSANLLIVIVLLHMLRAFFTGGFHGSRRFNWVVGLLLLFFVLVSNFTGYLLPWDQLSYWAITICTGMVGYLPGIGEWLQVVIRGGSEIGSTTLILFYTLHTSVAPVLLISLMAWHFWRVRKAGGVVMPGGPDAKPEHVLFLPQLLQREVALALILVAFVVVVSAIFQAPLGAPANPGMSPNPAKAPWYFLGFQELLFHFHPIVAVFVIPLCAVAALLSIPYLRYDTDLAGNWFLTPKGRKMAIVAAVAALVVTPLWVVVDELLFDLAAFAFPLSIAVVVAFYFLMKKRFESSNNEAIQSLFVFLLVAFAALTVTGVWFRGAGMALVWPWNL
jgi:quinol-cytochrome oxidoreductase complex cytochrome b subunit